MHNPADELPEVTESMQTLPRNEPGGKGPKIAGMHCSDPKVKCFQRKPIYPIPPTAIKPIHQICMGEIATTCCTPQEIFTLGVRVQAWMQLLRPAKATTSWVGKR